MVGYAENNIRDTYKLYNPETNRVIIIRYIKWSEFKYIDPSEIMKMFLNLNKEELVPGRY